MIQPAEVDVDAVNDGVEHADRFLVAQELSDHDRFENGGAECLIALIGERVGDCADHGGILHGFRDDEKTVAAADGGAVGVLCLVVFREGNEREVVLHVAEVEKRIGQEAGVEEALALGKHFRNVLFLVVADDVGAVVVVRQLIGFIDDVLHALTHDTQRERTVCRDGAAELIAPIAGIEGIFLNSKEGAIPNIVNISVPGIRSEIMLHFLENRGIYVSSGSACALGAKSHVLAAMGYDNARIDSAIRISFGRDTEKEDIDELVDALKGAMSTLCR